MPQPLVLPWQVQFQITGSRLVLDHRIRSVPKNKNSFKYNPSFFYIKIFFQVLCLKGPGGSQICHQKAPDLTSEGPKLYLKSNNGIEKE